MNSASSLAASGGASQFWPRMAPRGPLQAIALQPLDVGVSKNSKPTRRRISVSSVAEPSAIPRSSAAMSGARLRIMGQAAPALSWAAANEAGACARRRAPSAAAISGRKRSPCRRPRSKGEPSRSTTGSAKTGAVMALELRRGAGPTTAIQSRLQPPHEERHRPGDAEIDRPHENEDVQRQERFRHDDAAAQRQFVDADEGADGTVLKQRYHGDQKRREHHTHGLRKNDQPEDEERRHAAGERRFPLTAMKRIDAGPQDFCEIGAVDDAKADGARGKRRKGDAQAGQAEIDKVEDGHDRECPNDLDVAADGAVDDFDAGRSAELDEDGERQREAEAHSGDQHRLAGRRQEPPPPIRSVFDQGLKEVDHRGIAIRRSSRRIARDSGMQMARYSAAAMP